MDAGVLLVGQDNRYIAQLKVILDFLGKQCQCLTAAQLQEHNIFPHSCVVIDHSSLSAVELKQVYQFLLDNVPKLPRYALTTAPESVTQIKLQGFLVPPFSQDKVLYILDHAKTKQAQPSHTNVNPKVSNLLTGNSPAVNQIRHLLHQAAASDVNVLVTGESGSGKEVLARCLHLQSMRSNSPFVPVNCGAIPAELLESELFGHERGAFTGAISSRKGRFELAMGGTIFLDEIGDMPLAMQVKLLRVIQERCFERVGGNHSIQADVRIIAATHQDLEARIEQGKFREDLYYRLNVFPIEMPPLRARKEDIPVLIDELLTRYSAKQQRSLQLTPKVIDCLLNYPWPGNVRELSNLIERLLVLHPEGIVDVDNLPSKYLVRQDAEPQELDSPMEVANYSQIELPADGLDLKQHLLNTELALIKQALEKCNGVVAHAAHYLRMRRTTLVEKMRKHGITRMDLESV